MLADNIRMYRKSKQMSQDELAEKLGVTRQSISLWENGQTQPSLDNIVALAKLFDISTDALLTDNFSKAADSDLSEVPCEKNRGKRKIILITSVLLTLVVILIVVFVLSFSNNDEIYSQERNFDSGNDSSNISNENVEIESENENQSDDSANTPNVKFYIVQNGESLAIDDNVSDTETFSPTTSKYESNDIAENSQSIKSDEYENDDVLGNYDNENDIDIDIYHQSVTGGENINEVENETVLPEDTQNPQTENIQNSSTAEKDYITTVNEVISTPEVYDTGGGEIINQNTLSGSQPVEEQAEMKSDRDLFSYLKNIVVQNGILNGDYCYYSKTADNYGGFRDEDFTLYYWGDTDTIEFCLHSVLDDTFSINFYLRVPKTFNGEYEYISSYYYRNSGTPLYEAKGTIDAGEFTRNYPLKCNKYTGSADKQNDFMEMSRIGICDLIGCLKQFITVENLAYTFKDLGFTKF